MATQTRGYNLHPKDLFGVVKTFDLSGRVMDATPYFGKGGVKFGKTRKPYLLASAALVTPIHFIPIDMNLYWETMLEGAELSISNFTVNTH